MLESASEASAPRVGIWTHRAAWMLLVATFLMIWVGGLVTSYTAGMAVPDWPNTFGHIVFLYPWQNWLSVWDIFLEHGHRLLGTLVGTLAIILAALIWKTDPRPPIRWLGLAAVAAVCLQAVLGGLRVLADEILLAKIHGCTAPLVFALAAALVTFTSPAWRSAAQRATGATAGRLRRLTWATVVVVYVQIVLGAQLRHLQPDAATGWSVLWVWLHLIAAGALLALVAATAILIRRCFAEQSRLRYQARWLVVLVLVQLALGATVWITHYGWPVWFAELAWRPEYTVVAEGRTQVLGSTAHVAVGSLSLAVALSLALWSGKLTGQQPIPNP